MDETVTYEKLINFREMVINTLPEALKHDPKSRIVYLMPILEKLEPLLKDEEFLKALQVPLMVFRSAFEGHKIDASVYLSLAEKFQPYQVKWNSRLGYGEVYGGFVAMLRLLGAQDAEHAAFWQRDTLKFFAEGYGLLKVESLMPDEADDVTRLRAKWQHEYEFWDFVLLSFQSRQASFQ